MNDLRGNFKRDTKYKNVTPDFLYLITKKVLHFLKTFWKKFLIFFFIFWGVGGGRGGRGVKFIFDLSRHIKKTAGGKIKIWIPWCFTTSPFTTNTYHHEPFHHSVHFNIKGFHHQGFSPHETFHHRPQSTMEEIHHGLIKHCRDFLNGSSECFKRMHSIGTITNINFKFGIHIFGMPLPCYCLSQKLP